MSRQPEKFYEVTLARLGREIETVTVAARSEDRAQVLAERYLFANIYPLRTVAVDKPAGRVVRDPRETEGFWRKVLRGLAGDYG